MQIMLPRSVNRGLLFGNLSNWIGGLSCLDRAVNRSDSVEVAKKGIIEVVLKASAKAGYRADIDGLRAVAVLAVLLFHAFPATLQGGYVGVDVFFVISGYLITSIIHKDLIRGHFRFYDFWARRVRRIFPALLTVVVAVYLAGRFYLFRNEFQDLKEQIVWALGFAANFKFYRDIGYFDTLAELKTLLHLWSLAVEEQFYFLWPGFLFFCYQRKFNLLYLTVAFAGLSLVSNCFLSEGARFYLPLGRFWELQIGAVTAFLVTSYADRPKWYAGRLLAPVGAKFYNVFGLVGLILIVGAFFRLGGATDSRPVAVLGTAMVILAGDRAWTNRRILSFRFLVVIGLISFPLYLWHWPLLAFARILQLESRNQVSAVCILLSFVLAIATYNFVENFWRIDRTRLRWKAPFLVCGLVGLFVFINSRSGNLHMDRVDLSKIIDAMGSWDYPGRMVIHTFPNGLTAHEVKTNIDRYVLFIGDSHMQQYGPRIEKISAERSNETLSSLWVTVPGCLFVEGYDHPSYPECRQYRPKLFEIIRDAAKYRIDRIVFTGSFNAYLGIGENEQRDDRGDNLHDVRKKIEVRKAALSKFMDMVGHANGRKFVLLDPPLGEEFSPRVMMKRNLLGEIQDYAKYVTASDARSRRGMDIDRFIESGASRNNVSIIDPIDFLCHQNECRVEDATGRPRYRDGGHLAAYTARDGLSYIDRTVEKVAF